VKKTLFIIVLLSAGLYLTAAIASDEAGEGAANKGSSGEEIVTMCEDKYNSEKYADENERNNLIDACIKESTDKMAPRAEEG